MVHGFRKMDELLKRGGGTFKDRFFKVFGQEAPRPSTYHDQVRRWKRARPSLRSAALASGRTSAGHWSEFARAVPLK